MGDIRVTIESPFLFLKNFYKYINSPSLSVKNDYNHQILLRITLGNKIYISFTVFSGVSDLLRMAKKQFLDTIAEHLSFYLSTYKIEQKGTFKY